MKTYTSTEPFVLENKDVLPGIEISYHTFGNLNAEKSNVVWVCHALTANSNVFDWWAGLFGANALFNPEDHYIVCANILGSCYGSTGPLSIHPHSGQPWYSYFPLITVRDMVKAHDLLRTHLGIEKIGILIGGSLGAQQAVEWNVQRPCLFETTILIAGNARHSAWGIAFNESQRMAVKADRTYASNLERGGEKGLAAARSIALLSYRNQEIYNTTQQEKDESKLEGFKAASYQRYQGQKLAGRFNAYSYVALINAMDSHHAGRGYPSLASALARISARCLVIGIHGDILFPTEEQRFLATHIKGSQLKLISSVYGHDGFLLETAKLSRLISAFLHRRTAEPVGTDRQKALSIH